MITKLSECHLFIFFMKRLSSFSIVLRIVTTGMLILSWCKFPQPYTGLGALRTSNSLIARNSIMYGSTYANDLDLGVGFHLFKLYDMRDRN